MESDSNKLEIVSYNMHGFMQGYSVLEDLTKNANNRQWRNAIIRGPPSLS